MPMQLIHGFLALSAEMHEGKFSLLGGGFDALEVPTFPAALVSLAIVARIRVPHAEADRVHLASILIRDPDGTLLGENSTEVDVRNRPGPRVGAFAEGMIQNIIINMNGVVLTAGGVYRVEFLEAGTEFGRMEIPIFDRATIHGPPAHGG